MDFSRLVELAAALNAEQAEYVLVGGAAVNLQGIVRATEDFDLFIKPTIDNVESVKRALHRVWPDSHIEEISAAEICGEYPTIRYGPPGEDFVIDLISRLGTAVSFEDLEQEELLVQGVPIKVATPSTLYRMKRGTIRFIDKADAQALKEEYNLPEDP